MSLAGKIALVTGASRGIGRAIAVALSEAGAEVVTNSTGPLRLELKTKTLHVPGDVAKPADVNMLVDRALDTFGRVDILVNNAGVVVRAPIGEMHDRDFERVLAVNLTAPFYLCRRLAPPMVQRGEGRIVNISSISATMGTPSQTAYCASKWGLDGFTKALAAELEGTGVFVAALRPGSVDTDMLKGSPFPPRMEAHEVARVVRWLCDEAPMQMNGALVDMFG